MCTSLKISLNLAGIFVFLILLNLKLFIRANNLKINRIVCANVDGATAFDLNLLVSGMGSGTTGITTTGADSDVYLAKTISVPADSSLVVSDTPIYLMEGDILKGGGSTVNKLDLFISYETLID